MSTLLSVDMGHPKAFLEYKLRMSTLFVAWAIFRDRPKHPRSFGEVVTDMQCMRGGGAMRRSSLVSHPGDQGFPETSSNTCRSGYALRSECRLKVSVFEPTTFNEEAQPAEPGTPSWCLLAYSRHQLARASRAVNRTQVPKRFRRRPLSPPYHRPSVPGSVGAMVPREIQNDYAWPRFRGKLAQSQTCTPATGKV